MLEATALPTALPQPLPGDGESLKRFLRPEDVEKFLSRFQKWNDDRRRRFQCDQIWRNFATLAKAYKSLANVSGSISYLAKC